MSYGRERRGEATHPSSEKQTTARVMRAVFIPSRPLARALLPSEHLRRNCSHLRARDFRMMLLLLPRKAAQRGVVAKKLFAGAEASTICGGKEPQALMRAPCKVQGAANFALRRHGAGNSILTRKARLCKSAEKNCSEAGSYYSCLACRTGIIRTGIPKDNSTKSLPCAFMCRVRLCANAAKAYAFCSRFFLT